MNVQINEKLIDDSQKIDLGIRRLQSQLTNVIDRITDKNADPKAIIQMYKNDLATISTDLKEFLRQQEEFNRTVHDAEKEITAMADEVKQMMAQHKITIDEDIPNKEA